MKKKINEGTVITAPYETLTVAEFVGLPEWYVNIWDSLAALRDLVRDRRLAAGLTQAQLARRIESAQSVIARVENDGPGVGFDITMRALYALGLSRAEVAAAIAGTEIAAPVIPEKRFVKAVARPARLTAASAKHPTAKRRTAKLLA